jgi:phosphatidylserine synthase 2
MNGTAKSKRENRHREKDDNTYNIQNCQNHNGNSNDNNTNIGNVDPWTAWMYKPRTISLLLFGTCLLIWASGALDPESSSIDSISSVRRGLWAMISVFLVYSWLQAPSTVLIRPHPAIWRLVHGVAVVYLVALTFLLFQSRDDARQYMKFLHPDLGVGNESETILLILM